MQEPRLRTAVIGAGLSGLECARRLQAAGREVLVFDKGRGPGGRCTTRRLDSLQFDHGAQYFTARDPEFRALVADLIGAGILSPWQPRIVVFREGLSQALQSQPDRFVAVPSMSALPKALAQGLNILLERRVRAIQRDDRMWRIEDQEGLHPQAFDEVVLALPPAQARALAPPGFHRDLERVSMTPCLGLLVTLLEDAQPSFDAAFVDDDEVLSWVARDGSKPGRPRGTTWVLHAHGAFSSRNFTGDDADLMRIMSEALGKLLGSSAPIEAHELKRWRYALSTGDTEPGTLYSGELALGICGDWCRGGRIEGAWESGRDLAAAILAHQRS